MSEVKFDAAGAMREIISERLADGVSEIAFTAEDVIAKAAQRSADEYERRTGEVVSDEEKDRNREMFEIHFASEANKKILTSYSANIIKRHLEKYGKQCVIKTERGEMWNEAVVTMFDDGIPLEKQTKKRREGKLKVQTKAVEAAQAANDDAIRIKIDALKMQVKALAMWVPDFTQYNDEELSTVRRLLEEFRKCADALNGNPCDPEEMAE